MAGRRSAREHAILAAGGQLQDLAARLVALRLQDLLEAVVDSSSSSTGATLPTLRIRTVLVWSFDIVPVPGRRQGAARKLYTAAR